MFLALRLKKKKCPSSSYLTNINWPSGFHSTRLIILLLLPYMSEVKCFQHQLHFATRRVVLADVLSTQEAFQHSMRLRLRNAGVERWSITETMLLTPSQKKKTPPKKERKGSASSSQGNSRPGTPLVDAGSTSSMLRAAANKLEQGRAVCGNFTLSVSLLVLYTL